MPHRWVLDFMPTASPADAIAFEQLGKQHDLPAGEPILSAGQERSHLFALIGGQLIVEHRGIEVQRLESGDFVGEDALVRATTPHVDIKTAETSRIWLAPLNKVLELANDRPAFGVILFEKLLAQAGVRLTSTTGLFYERQSLTRKLGETNDELRKTLSELAQAHDRLLTESRERERAEKENVLLARFASDSPSPMLRVSRDGEILYANSAATPLLASLKADRGRFLPSTWRDRVRDAVEQHQVLTTELEASGQVWTLYLSPVADEGTAHIYAHDITLAKDTEAQMLQMARQDPLTGLVNRGGFNEALKNALAQAGRTGVGGALFFLDLDLFKEVNDTFGHHVGDLLLKAVAKRLKQKVRDTDTVARLGGDEFAVIQNPVNSDVDVKALVKRIISSLSEPMVIEGYRVQVGVSVGIARFPEDATEADEIIRAADTAMYRVKAAGRNSYRLYSDETDALHATRQEANDAVTKGLERGDFVLYYQPTVDIASGDVRALEALVRWRHPIHGMVRPDGLFVSAEYAGLLPQLADWIVLKACEGARHLSDRGIRWPVTINLTRGQFLDADWPRRLSMMLSTLQLDPHLIELEIPERLVLDNHVLAERTMDQLAALGVDLALDDVGLGELPVTLAARLPIRRIKIAQVLTTGIGKDSQSDRLIRAITSVGRALGLEMIAKGVETPQQRDFLTSCGVETVMGFLYGEPAPLETLIEQKVGKPVSA
ncbi:putative bifunctional diguanylate cyclase/phosphodiesterase [Lacibacterium aquatile]|uniref:Bifunctional diguanylate cyclase/phosphodiesterase n=1 Tax=Lacibacterium aquatile TaxID=1168082 RepID=A0ABW5DQ59_9PROT